tara:strand:+ start:126 stop:542 length:417 start_codon:yes stop_codon:yes gene_type:complete
MSNSTTINVQSTIIEAQSVLLNSIRLRLQDLNVMPSTHVDVFARSCGLAVRLHNLGLRPTVYTVDFSCSKYGTLSGIVIDTIVRENKSHETLKIVFGVGHIDSFINTITRLARQACDGDAVETGESFERIGLLYKKRV